MIRVVRTSHERWAVCFPSGRIGLDPRFHRFPLKLLKQVDFTFNNWRASLKASLKDSWQRSYTEKNKKICEYQSSPPLPSSVAWIKRALIHWRGLLFFRRVLSIISSTESLLRFTRTVAVHSLLKINWQMQVYVAAIRPCVWLSKIFKAQNKQWSTCRGGERGNLQSIRENFI